jgi:hypothetical protein
MVEIPQNQVTLNDLMAWDEAVRKLDAAKDAMKPLAAAEKLLRMRCFKGFFPEPKEGTNSYALSGGYVLKATYKVKRDVDDVLLANGLQVLREAQIATDSLFRYKPALEVKAYRGYTAEQIHLIDQFLIIKPETPEMEIVLPAKEKERIAAQAAIAEMQQSGPTTEIIEHAPGGDYP